MNATHDAMKQPSSHAPSPSSRRALAVILTALFAGITASACGGQGPGGVSDPVPAAPTEHVAGNPNACGTCTASGSGPTADAAIEDAENNCASSCASGASFADFTSVRATCTAYDGGGNCTNYVGSATSDCICPSSFCAGLGTFCGYGGQACCTQYVCGDYQVCEEPGGGGGGGGGGDNGSPCSSDLECNSGNCEDGECVNLF